MTDALGGQAASPTPRQAASSTRVCLGEKYGKGIYPSSIFDRDADAGKIAAFALNRQKNMDKYPYAINPFGKNKFNVCHTFARDALRAGQK